MRLHALEIPDDPAELPGWLERQLTGLDLAALVAELEAVHGPGAVPTPTLPDLLGERRDAVLSGGLGVLPTDSLRPLLRHPELLLELQELVLHVGTNEWVQRTERFVH